MSGVLRNQALFPASLLVGLLLAGPAWAQQAQPDLRDAAPPRAFAEEQLRAPYRTLTLGAETVTFQEIDGLAVVEGDIVLASVAELEAAAADMAKSGADQLPARLRNAAIYVTGSGQPRLWPNATIYYEIALEIPNQRRITDAIAHWMEKTPIRLVPRTGQTSYVRFVRGASTLCASAVGRLGGQQTIQLGDQCDLDAAIHEIGHAVGLMHEQTRPDRNQHLTVLYENIDKDAYAQFHQGPEIEARGYYDFASIMHYSATAFSTNGRITQQTVPAGIPLGQRGQRLGLSTGDIDEATRLYGFQPSQTTITTIPEGLDIIVDGERYLTPVSFDWAPGTAHTLEADARQQFTRRYPFQYWTNGGARVHQFIATPEITAIAAVYVRKNQLTVRVGEGQGSVSVSPASHDDGYYPEGTAVQFSAQPAPGFRFQQWTGTSLRFDEQGSATLQPVLDLRFNSEYIADFTAEPLTNVTSVPPGRDVIVDGIPYITPVSFAWTAGTQHVISLATSQTNFSGNIRYRFDRWEDGSAAGNRTILAREEGAVLTAGFETQYLLSTDVSGLGFLNVSPFSVDRFYDAGSIVNLDANPLGTRQVLYWLGDLSGGGQQRQIVMDGPKLAVPVFGGAVAFQPFNAGSFSSNPVFDEAGLNITPLEVISLFGNDIGPSDAQTGNVSAGMVGTSIDNVRVLFNGVAAPVLFASPTQISTIVPASVAGSPTATIIVERNGFPVGAYTARVLDTLPGLFTADASGRGPLAAVNQDGSINSALRPAARGSVAVLYATGAGLMDQALADGSVTGTTLGRPLAPVFVRIGGVPAVVEYSGSAPGLVQGALQINIRVPETLLPGEHPIVLIVGEHASPPGTTIWVKD